MYVSIGAEDIHNTVTYPLFCRDHDQDLFKPIENGNRIEVHQPNLEQVFLLQYRIVSVLVSEMNRAQFVVDNLNPIAQTHHLYEHEANELAKLQADIKNKGVYKAFHQCERIRITKQYDRLDCRIFVIDVPHSIAAALAFTPLENNDSHQSVSLKDYLFFTLLPYVGTHKSVCILSWLKESKRAEQFIHQNKLHADHDLPDDEKKKVFFQLAFESSHLYLSPTWWKQTLSDQERVHYIQVRTNIYKKYVPSLGSFP